MLTDVLSSLQVVRSPYPTAPPSHFHKVAAALQISVPSHRATHPQGGPRSTPGPQSLPHIRCSTMIVKWGHKFSSLSQTNTSQTFWMFWHWAEHHPVHSEDRVSSDAEGTLGMTRTTCVELLGVGSQSVPGPMRPKCWRTHEKWLNWNNAAIR